MNRIEIKSSFKENALMPSIKIDGNEIGVTHFVLKWDVGEPAKIDLEMYLKDARVDLEGNFSINGVPFPALTTEQMSNED